MPNNLAVHFSSATDDWATPQAFFDEMYLKYGPFDLDVCASHENAKTELYCTPEGLFKKTPSGPFQKYGVDGLAANWVGRCWMNPPYGREIKHWVKKAYEESNKGNLVCCLLPARTDTRWFHDFIYTCDRVTIEFIRGRLKFGNATNSAPFPSMIVVFNPPKGE